MKSGDFSFLFEPVRQAIKETGWTGLAADPLAIFVIQLRRPDFWIVLVCNSSPQRSVLLFDGTWPEAVDHFSSRPPSFPEPVEDIDFYEIVRDVVWSTITDFSKALVRGGHSGFGVHRMRVLGMEQPGVLDPDLGITPAELTKAPQLINIQGGPPFRVAPDERTAHFCRFLIIQEPGKEQDAEKAKLIRALSDDDLFYGEVGWRLIYKGIEIVVFKDGILVADEKNEAKALEALNAFVAFAHSNGVACNPFTERDLADLRIGEDGYIRMWSHLGPSERQLGTTKNVISAVTMNRIATLFPLQTDEERLIEMRLLHLASRHFNQGETLQAFSLAWIVIERNVSTIWEKMLSARGFSKNKVAQLCEPDRYTMSVKTEVLELLNIFSADQAQQLHSLRRARNKASHEGRVPEKQATRDCLRIASQFVKDAESLVLGLHQTNLSHRDRPSTH